MTRNLILGTAGHIDHGKTSLIKMLTGVDTDRLPEEKARGISIDIGFAQITTPQHQFGVVDCPGHEKFIKNMLAGATGIDLALLVVAADDGIMPQTREHLDILRYLGIPRGVIAITKADLVDESALELLELEIRDAMEKTFLAEAPIVRTAIPTEQGKAELLQALDQQADTAIFANRNSWFRLPIDRIFVVQGHGTVVTGSIISGTTHVGDELELQPAGTRVRVRGLQSHSLSHDQLGRSQRAAINLADVDSHQLHRGHELATPGYLQPSRLITVQLEAVARYPRGLRHRLPVRLHAGTTEAMGVLSLLEADHLNPGQHALAQIFLDEPVTVTWGQPFIVRDSAATITLGGGKVIQPTSRKIHRRQLEPMRQLQELQTNDPLRRLTAFAWFRGSNGFTPPELVREIGIMPGEIDPTIATATTQQVVQRLGKGNHYFSAAIINELANKVLQELLALHRANPLQLNYDRQHLISRFHYLNNDPMVDAVIEHLVDTQQVTTTEQGRKLAHADFRPRLTHNQLQLKNKIVAAILQGGLQPPELEEFRKMAGTLSRELGEVIAVAIAKGEIVPLTATIFLHQQHLEAAKQHARTLATGGNGFTVSELREKLQTTRKYAVPLCEYFDKIGFTRRENDRRYLVE
ncbi:MAG: selenocysteine-specific translation elongation factor [Zavarzinella sp.]